MMEPVCLLSKLNTKQHIEINLYMDELNLTDAKKKTIHRKIKDYTGCGMTPEVGAHVFEKFYQGDTSHSVQSNGLGRALVKRVIDSMQGEISVESAVGKDFMFIVKVRRT